MSAPVGCQDFPPSDSKTQAGPWVHKCSALKQLQVQKLQTRSLSCNTPTGNSERSPVPYVPVLLPTRGTPGPHSAPVPIPPRNPVAVPAPDWPGDARLTHGPRTEPLPCDRQASALPTPWVTSWSVASVMAQWALVLTCSKVLTVVVVALHMTISVLIVA